MIKAWKKINPGWRRIIIVINFPAAILLGVWLLEQITNNSYLVAAIALMGTVSLFIKIPLLGVFYWIYDGFKKNKKNQSKENPAYPDAEVTG